MSSRRTACPWIVHQEPLDVFVKVGGIGPTVLIETALGHTGHTGGVDGVDWIQTELSLVTDTTALAVRPNPSKISIQPQHCGLGNPSPTVQRLKVITRTRGRKGE